MAAGFGVGHPAIIYAVVSTARNRALPLIMCS